MRSAEDFDRVDRPGGMSGWSLTHWEVYDPSSKVDLHSHALTLPDGRTFVFDPIPLASGRFRDLLRETGGTPAGVILTSGNHGRAAEEYRREWSIPLCAHPAAGTAAGLELDVTPALPAGLIFDGALEAIPLEGGAPGECAFYHAEGGGLLLVGDAIVDLPGHPFSLLPDKYCTGPKLLRTALAGLLDRAFGTLTLAHGRPIITEPRARLAALLGEPLPPLP